MSAYAKAQEWNLTGSDAENVAALRASGVTAWKIALADLLFTLNNRGMVVRLIRPADTGEKWAGTVVNMVLALNASGSPEQAAAVNQWFSHITNDRNQFFDTTNPAFSAPFWALSQSVADGPGMPSSADFAAVAALGGGWLFADLTVEQFAAQREAAEAISQKQDLRSRIDTAWNQIGTSEQAEAVAELRAIADELESV
jgi:hypothetical protein